MLLGTYLRDQVEGDRVGEGAVFKTAVGNRGFGRLDEFFLPRDPRTAGSLVGANHHAADAARVVQRFHGEHHLRGRTVGTGDDALVVADRLRVHLRHHQRHFGVHSPVAALVNHDAAALDRPGRELGRHGVGCAANRQIDACKRIGHHFLDRVLLSFEFDRRPCRPSGGEELDVLVGKVALHQELADQTADGASGAHNGDGIKHGKAALLEVESG